MKFLNFKLFLLLLLISFICGLPHIVGYYFQGKEYTLFSSNVCSLNSREEVYAYMPKVKQILNGAIIPHDIHLLEHQKSPSPYIGEALPAYVMAFFSFLSGSVERGFILADFLLPPAIFLIIYWFAVKTKKNRGLAIVIGLSVIFSRDFFVYFPYPIKLFSYLFQKESFVDSLVITRSFHPEVSMVFFLLALFSMFFALTKETISKKHKIVAGFLLGLTFYTYIFYWTGLLFGLLIFTCLNFNKKKILKRIFVISLIAFIVSVPYLILTLNFEHSIFAKDFFFRSTGFRTEFPYSRSIRFVIISLLIFIIFRNKNQKLNFYNSMILAGAILPDLTLLILKKDLETSRWIHVFVKPIAAIFYFLILEKYLLSRRRPFYRKIIYLILCIAFIFYAAKIQDNVAFQISRYQRLSNEQKDMYRFLNSVPKNSVVASSEENQNKCGWDKNFFVPAATNNLIYTPYATMTVATTNEIIERYITLLLQFNKKTEISKDAKNSVLWNSYTFLNSEFIENNQSIYNQKINEKIEDAKLFCRKYKLDYLVLNGNQKANDFCFRFKKVYENSKYVIYKNISQ